MKKILLYGLLVCGICIGCEKDSGPTFCWWCVDELGNDVTIIKDKTEQWTSKNAGKFEAVYNGGANIKTVCHSFEKTNCR